MIVLPVWYPIGMKLYADQPVRWTRQVVADAAAVALLLLAVWLATEVRSEVLRLRAPGDGMVIAGARLTEAFDSAADNADDVPLVGDALAEALQSGAGAGADLSAAGRAQVEAVESLALWLTVGLIAVPAAFLLILWLPRRVRFVREASSAGRLRRLGEDGHDLLALRGLANLPLPSLPPGLAAGWRAADPAAIATLAAAELRRLGLRNP